VLQCVAVCCSVLQCIAVCCSVLSHMHSMHLYYMYVCSVLQCVAVCCSVLQCVAVCHHICIICICITCMCVPQSVHMRYLTRRPYHICITYIRLTCISYHIRMIIICLICISPQSDTHPERTKPQEPTPWTIPTKPKIVSFIGLVCKRDL